MRRVRTEGDAPAGSACFLRGTDVRCPRPGTGKRNAGGALGGGVRARPPRSAAPRPVPADAAPPAAPGGPAGTLPDVSAAKPLDVSAETGCAEIGRASCRERV